MSQRFVSVDGRSHVIDMLFSQSVQAPASEEVPGFLFPGQSSFATHSQPDSFAAFPGGPGSIVAIGDNSGFLPATSNPIGAITYSRPPTSADFISAKGAQTATLLMHYTGLIAAGGATVYDWSFSQASSAPTLAVLEAVERDRFRVPSVTISRPRNRPTVRTALVRVQGTGHDAVGVSSQSVNGHGVPVSGGAFAATVRVRPCKVPKLRGTSLATARRAISNSGCALGRVKHKHSRSVRKGRVSSNAPQTGSKHRHGTKVALLISRGR